MPETPTNQQVREAVSAGRKTKARRLRGARRSAAAATEVAAEQQDKTTLTRAARAGRTAAKKRKIPAAKAGATREGYKLGKRPASLGGGYFWKKVI